MKINKIKLSNFRNFDQLEIEFDQVTEIVRNNGWGKSNIADAIAWVLTGHLFDGSSDIESIKPKKDSRRVVEVELYLDNGLQLRKNYRENWNKTRGSNDFELKGHSTSYYINGLEMTQTAYDNQLNDHLNIDKDTYHLLIDPTYFGLKLEWKARRAIINEIVGEITFNEIVGVDPVFTNNQEATAKLHNALMGFNYKVDLTKKSFIQNLNKLKKDEKEMEAQITGLNLITTTINEAQYIANKEADDLAKTEIYKLSQNEDSQSFIKKIETELEYLRERYRSIDAETFTGVKPVSHQCPQCGFNLESDEFNKRHDQYQANLNNFIANKATRLSKINSEGVGLRTKLEQLKGGESGTADGYTEIIQKLKEEIINRESDQASYLAWSSAQVKIKEVSDRLELIRKEINDYELLSDLLGFYVSAMLGQLDQRLKKVFGDIKFRLIEPNIKEGSWNEVCEVLDGEVPYDRTNTASQIKIGVKLIDAIRIQKGYTSLPIIIDNAEAVVDRNFEVNSQIICLIAGKETH
jgi:rubrerythrin